MDVSKEPNRYSTADFRKNMTEVFESARFRNAVVDVSHHGKPWVSVISSEDAERIRRIRELGPIEAKEIGGLIDSMNAPIEIDELLFRLGETRKQRDV